jgi:hypothetical protein
MEKKRETGWPLSLPLVRWLERKKDIVLSRI